VVGPREAAVLAQLQTSELDGVAGVEVENNVSGVGSKDMLFENLRVGGWHAHDSERVNI
jgi:hypothetical protein